MTETNVIHCADPAHEEDGPGPVPAVFYLTYPPYAGRPTGRFVPWHACLNCAKWAVEGATGEEHGEFYPITLTPLEATP